VVTPDFSEAGLTAFARIAKLRVFQPGILSSLTMQDATIAHGPVTSTSAAPCVTLSDGTGVWVRMGNPNAPETKDYCPFRKPAFYSPDA
jgi:hypothetical protein